MLDTKLFEIIIFCFKILFYQFDTQEADIEVLKNGTYEMTFHYVQKENDLHVTAIRQGQENPLIKVKTIDNALYQVELEREEPFNLDLSYIYMAIDWEQLGKKDLVLTNDKTVILEIKVGTSNVYINAPGNEMTFVLNRKYFSK